MLHLLGAFKECLFMCSVFIIIEWLDSDMFRKALFIFSLGFIYSQSDLDAFEKLETETINGRLQKSM